MENKKFKPELLPNNAAGENPDWELLLGDVSEWLWSNKLDGGRAEIIHDGMCLGRSLKLIPSINIQNMSKEIIDNINYKGVIEAEFYSHNMTFGEIMHFFRSENVASDKNKKKLDNEWKKTKQGTTSYTKKIKGINVEAEWEFPGRDPEWLSKWHDDLKFYIFNLYQTDPHKISYTKEERYFELLNFKSSLPDSSVIISQNTCDHIDGIYQAYDQAILDNYEGIVVFKKTAKYKLGRHRLKSAQAFKIKEDNLEFDGKIIGVEEATKVREGAEKTTNELGRSVTSKKLEDRLPAGYAKGFLTEMEDGRTLTVSFKGYDTEAKKLIFLTKEKYIGRWIRFSGMKPVKEGGVPRHAHFKAGNFREDKD